VVLVARGEHLQVMQQHGLKVHHESMLFDAAVAAFDTAALTKHYGPDDFDVALLALISTATQTVLDELGAAALELAIEVAHQAQPGLEQQDQRRPVLAKVSGVGPFAGAGRLYQGN
jgi:2-dehydropantoate 2-reductase